MAGVCSLHSPCLLRRNDQGYEVTCQIVWLSEHGAHRSFLFWKKTSIEESQLDAKPTGCQKIRDPKNKCSLAQWSRGAYQLQVRLFGTQHMEPIVCFFFERKHPRKKVVRKQKIRVSKKNEITEA